MIHRALVAIAGVDRDTLKTCPATDKLWAAHLGFALCLSFIVVLGISFHATGYMIADPWMRGAVSLVIALTVFMSVFGHRSMRPCFGPAVGESVTRAGLSQTSVEVLLRKNEPS